MLILDQFKPIPIAKGKKTLTIGNFDGVHKGHQFLLAYLKKLAGSDGCVGAVTFKHHTSHLFGYPVKEICRYKDKVELLKEHGVDILFSLDFDKSLANYTYEEFLRQIREVYPFDHLILGEDSYFGKNREGGKENVVKFAKEHDFKALYLPKIAVNHTQVSSRLIRQLISERKCSIVYELLGRTDRVALTE
ncbi:MAG: hypothetical protein ACOVOR_01680 [Rhabdochlamydiaceae bacterium]